MSIRLTEKTLAYPTSIYNCGKDIILRSSVVVHSLLSHNNLFVFPTHRFNRKSTQLHSLIFLHTHPKCSNVVHRLSDTLRFQLTGSHTQYFEWVPLGKQITCGQVPKQRPSLVRNQIPYEPSAYFHAWKTQECPSLYAQAFQQPNSRLHLLHYQQRRQQHCTQNNSQHYRPQS